MRFVPRRYDSKPRRERQLSKKLKALVFSLYLFAAACGVVAILSWGNLIFLLGTMISLIAAYEIRYIDDGSDSFANSFPASWAAGEPVPLRSSSWVGWLLLIVMLIGLALFFKDKILEAVTTDTYIIADGLSYNSQAFE